MSKADEMFKNLGYKNTFSSFYEHDFGTTIKFNDCCKEIIIGGVIDVNDLQAINKKIKELGWIE